MAVIPTTGEVEIGMIIIQGQPREKVSKVLSQEVS
jgi:translation initiation factor 1 (eIF-1/SUI1)